MTDPWRVALAEKVTRDERRKALREVLAQCRAEGKRIRHQRRLQVLAAKAREEGTKP